MIFGNIENLNEYTYLDENIKNVLNMQKIMTYYLMIRDVIR